MDTARLLALLASYRDYFEAVDHREGLQALDRMAGLDQETIEEILYLTSETSAKLYDACAAVLGEVPCLILDMEYVPYGTLTTRKSLPFQPG